jgi:hypothetical protein
MMGFAHATAELGMRAGKTGIAGKFKQMKANYLLKLAVLAGTGVFLAASPAAVAQVYNFSFVGAGGMDATGTITTAGGVATGGSIFVTGVPVEASPSTLVTASGDLLTAGGDVRNHDGDVITYDTVANPLSDPVFDSTGVAFGSDFFGYDGGTPEYNTIINIWGNSPGSYSMFVGQAQLDGNGNVIGDAQWVYTQDNGSLTLTPAPEPSVLTNTVFLGGLTAGFMAIRRRRAAAK